MIMKKTAILLTVLCVLMACKKNNVDFSYTPTEPRAGETVKFSNLSSSGEEWEWTFGDGATATIKSPSHTYKQPGTYRVMLKVDKRAAWTKTKEITVYDTIPTFVCADSVFSIYNDYTFEANIYNPYNYEVSYLWVLPLDMDYFTPTDEDLTSSTLKGYFTRPLVVHRDERRHDVCGKEFRGARPCDELGAAAYDGR